MNLSLVIHTPSRTKLNLGSTETCTQSQVVHLPLGLPNEHSRPAVPERIVVWNGRSITNPDYVEPPHVDTDEDFDNELVDSQSDVESSEFGDNGYVDSTSDSEEEECDGQFRPQASPPRNSIVSSL